MVGWDEQSATKKSENGGRKGVNVVSTWAMRHTLKANRAYGTDLDAEIAPKSTESISVDCLSEK